MGCWPKTSSICQNKKEQHNTFQGYYFKIVAFLFSQNYLLMIIFAQKQKKQYHVRR